MKKSIIFIFLFLFIFSIKASASSWMFVWEEETTTIEIPLGANLQNYISKPKAKLYRDGTLLEDAEIHYITTGDWLYLLTDVDTQKVGTYQVWYKAVENKYKPGQCQGYKTLVTFEVIDLEKPIFVEYPRTISYWIGAPKPNYMKQITATDNSGNCEITIDDSLVDYEKPGTYTLFVRASDQRNITEQQIEIVVQDPVGPVITFLGENNHILITKGEEVKLQSYFKAVDKTDGDVTDSITYAPFSTEISQSFELEVSFFDRSHNESTMMVYIEIVDKDEVNIELYKSILLLEYTSDFKKALKENIKSAYLGKTSIVEDIIIDFENIRNEVGSYMVSYIYEAKDKSKKIECELKLLSNQAPVLLVENINVSLNEKPNLLNHVTVYDSSDPLIDSKIEYDDSLVDYTKPGTYPVRITVTNSSALSSSETLWITVVGTSNQVIEGSNTFYLIPMGIGVGVIGIGVVIFLHFKKKRNCNKEQNQL